MADQKLPVSLHLTLRSGTVYYFKHRALSSPYPHFFTVINKNPLADRILVLAVGSSRIDKVRARRAGLPDETLVVVEPGDYSEFKRATVIDCNQVCEIAMAELVQKLQTGQLRHHPDLPKAILERIWIGVRSSPLVEDVYKKMLP